MIEVTVLFLDETFSSTAVGPMEVFRHAGTLWNLSRGKTTEFAFSRDHRISGWAHRSLRRPHTYQADPVCT